MFRSNFYFPCSFPRCRHCRHQPTLPAMPRTWTMDLGHASKVYFSVATTSSSSSIVWSNGVNRFGARENRYFVPFPILTPPCATRHSTAVNKTTASSAYSFTHFIFFYCGTFVLLQIVKVYTFFCCCSTSAWASLKFIHRLRACEGQSEKRLERATEHTEWRMPRRSRR